jgi:hypothetical protein
MVPHAVSVPIAAGPDKYLADLLDAGLLISSGVPGVYGLGGRFESVVEQFEAYVTRLGGHLAPEVMRFPPILSRTTYKRTDHLETFPNLMGSIHSFAGTPLDHRELSRKSLAGEDWTTDLKPTDVMMVPAACYPLYPTATGVLGPDGRLVDLRAFVFRHEPSLDPARMQIFRQREYVRLGTNAARACCARLVSRSTRSSPTIRSSATRRG